MKEVKVIGKYDTIIIEKIKDEVHFMLNKDEDLYYRVKLINGSYADEFILTSIQFFQLVECAKINSDKVECDTENTSASTITPMNCYAVCAHNEVHKATNSDTIVIAMNLKDCIKKYLEYWNNAGFELKETDITSIKILDTNIVI